MWPAGPRTATLALHRFEDDELPVVTRKSLEIRLITELSSETVTTPVPHPAPLTETMSALTEPLAGLTISEPAGLISEMFDSGIDGRHQHDRLRRTRHRSDGMIR